MVRAVERLVALQAQYPPSPYVALWSRLAGFRKEHLTRALERGTVVKGWPIRGTLHVSTAATFADLAAGALESVRGRWPQADVEAVAAAIGDRALSNQELFAVAGEALDTDDRWTIARALRRIPAIRTPPSGPWPHTKPTPVRRWKEPLPPHEEATGRVVRAYLAAYGPATRRDIEQFTGFRLRQIDRALEGMRELGDGLYDVRGGRVAAANAPAPPRFLPPYDSIILAHRDRSRILPADYYETVIRRKNATTLATFTVDGFIAGSWRIERVRGRSKILLEPFAPVPRTARRELDEEAASLAAFYDA